MDADDPLDFETEDELLTTPPLAAKRLDMTETSAESLQVLTESVEHLNVENPGSISIDNDHHDAGNVSDDDIWGEDDDIDDTSLLNREWKLRHDQHHKMGYVEGITAGKQASAQEGFNTGFKQSVHAGYKLGLARGISSTLASLSDQLKMKLAGTPENNDRVGTLHGSLQAISTKDAEIMFYDGIRRSASSQSCDHSYLSCNALEILFKELELFVAEAPELAVNFEFCQERAG